MQVFTDTFYVQPGDTVQLQAPAGFPALTLGWTANTDLSCLDCPDPWLVALQDAVYAVTLEGYGGCRVKGFYPVVPRAIPINDDFYIPNVIKAGSANDDFFTIFSGKDLTNVRLLRIYTRWGELVKEFRDFAPNGPIGWRGEFPGRKDVLPGVYVYYTELEFSDGSLRFFKGDVTVVR